MKKAATFGLSLFTLIVLAGDGWAQTESAITSTVLVKTHASWEGSDLPSYPEGQPEITVLRVTIPPKTHLPMHEHPVITAGVVLQGRLIVETGEGKTLHLEPGMAVAEVVDRWHHARNDGEEPVEIIVFYAGVLGQPVSIAKSDNE
jgi:quercetin dioxygenase-like cupin family protein